MAEADARPRPRGQVCVVPTWITRALGLEPDGGDAITVRRQPLPKVGGTTPSLVYMPPYRLRTAY